MSTQTPEIIAENNLSYAWGRAFLAVMRRPAHTLSPLTISINGLSDGRPAEDSAVRNELDASLCTNDKYSSAISAATIFPARQWWKADATSRKAMYDWFLEKMLPRLRRRNVRNQYGTYFERMIAFHGVKCHGERVEYATVNQLERLITDWNRPRQHRKRPRHSALQIACFDPAKDLTGQSVRGFPCLQQVSLAYDDQNGLALSAYYPTQYIYDRAYGNYLGLCHLGRFLAEAMGLQFVRFNCFVAHPELGDINKTALRSLEVVVETAMAGPKAAQGASL